jgi:REP element-mobilizing transposase RayT
VFWYEIKNHAKNIELGAFVVMPNHIHGLLILNNAVDDGPMAVNVVETTHALSLPPPPPSPPPPSKSNSTQPQPSITIGQSRFQNQGENSISSIVGSYKSAVTKHAHRIGYDFEWQSRFYDHIIRDGDEYQRISNYIITNPANWHIDKFHSS